MITKLVLKNFKSISESGIEIDLKPLTVLMGPNASGKSSILEAIGIFVQSIDRPINSKGNLVFYRDFIDIIHKRETSRWLTIEIHVDDLGYRYSFKKLNEEARQSVVIGDKEMVRMTNEFFEGMGINPDLNIQRDSLLNHASMIQRVSYLTKGLLKQLNKLQMTFCIY